MSYVIGIDANLLAILVMLVLSAERIPKSKYNKEKKALKAMVINLTLFLSFDTLYRVLSPSEIELYVKLAFISKSFYFLENGILVYLWSRYVGKLLWDEQFQNKWYKYVFDFSICLVSIIILSNFFTPILFRIGKGGKLIVYELCMYILTIVNYSNVVITYTSLVKNRRRLKSKNFYLLICYPIAALIAEILQLIFRDIDVMSLYALSAFLISKVDNLNETLRDPMTGLGNRLLLDDKLKRWFDSIRNAYICGIMLDINNLKSINDTYGHPAGDEVIQYIADLIKEVAINHNLYPIRYGGDEFVLIWKAPTRESAKAMLKTLRKDEKKAVESIPEIRRVSYSTGSVICSPEDDMTAEDFLWLLDMRMYEGKHETEKKIEYAIRNGGLHIMIQPIFSIPENRLVSGEALLRLTDEEGNELLPKDFIPVAEKSGSIYQLEHFVMNEICKIASIPDFTERGLHRIGINISATHAARESLPDYLINTAKSYGIPCNRICVELTETAVSSNQEVYARNISKLHDAGFKLCIDDFGTGYSNLRRLSSLALDMVKIDRQLVSPDSPRSRKLIQLSVNIIHGLGYDVVAEGVENEEQAEYMRELDVEYIQGFYYAKPLTPEEFLEQFPCIK